MFIYVLISLLFVHWLFDFMLQPRKWANDKWQSMEYLFGHVMIYTMGLTAFLMITYTASPGILFFLGANVFAHAFVDFFTSKINHMYYESKKYYQFFGMIGFDQFVHVAILLWTAQYFLSQLITRFQ